MAQGVKVLCKSCRNVIDRDAAFCPICGASRQKQGVRKGIGIKLPSGKTATIAVISGACVVVLAAAVIIGIVIGRSSSNNNTEDPTGSDGWMVSEEPSPTPSPTLSPTPASTSTPMSSPTSIPAQSSTSAPESEALSDSKVIMTLGLAKEDDIPGGEDLFLATDIARNEIVSVTFLDSLAQMPENAWDVSEAGNKLVMAWTEQRSNGGYDVFIGAEGGVEAHENSAAFFANMNRVEQIRMENGFRTENVKDMRDMFRGCSSLTGLHLNNFHAEWMEIMGLTWDQVVIGDLVFDGDGISYSNHGDYTESWQSAGYRSRGWHETFSYADDPGTALHIVYFEPYSELAAESGYVWKGPVMNAYSLEEEMCMNLYQAQNGQQISRLRILPLNMDGDLRDQGVQEIADRFEARLISSGVLEDNGREYCVRCEVRSSWGGGSSGLIYAVQDYSTGTVYLYEYVILDHLYVGTAPMDRLLETMTPVDMEAAEIDKENGLLQ